MFRKFGIFTPPISLSRYIVFLLTSGCLLFHKNDQRSVSTRGDQKVRGKVLLNRNALIDCNENSQI